MTARYLALVTSLMLSSGLASAQSAAEHIALGDQAYDRMEAPQALEHYEAALAVDSTNYEALWKSAREYADLAEYESDDAKRKEMYATAERLARRAVAADSTDAEGHFNLARALGRVALSVGVRDRIKYARDVRSHALRALEDDPDHPGALHVLGVWNAEVMRLSGLSRWMARNFLGGSVFKEASWDNARSYLEKAAAVDPDRIVHRLDLARVYLDTKERDKARAQLQMVIDGRIVDYNDRHYKDEAAALLRELNG